MLVIYIVVLKLFTATQTSNLVVDATKYSRTRDTTDIQTFKATIIPRHE